jgi:hypothetical protein
MTKEFINRFKEKLEYIKCIDLIYGFKKGICKYKKVQTNDISNMEMF